MIVATLIELLADLNGEVATAAACVARFGTTAREPINAGKFDGRQCGGWGSHVKDIAAVRLS